MRKTINGTTVRWVSAIILSMATGASAYAQAIPAFPGAEGYGSVTRGGRGGKVIAVTNLNASGPGSLRAAFEADGPRTVVFRVSGTIEGDFQIRNDNITIAGQTAPGDGICIKGTLGIGANDVIIRYLRVRAVPGANTDAIGSRYKQNIILDHVSGSWSSDEVMSIYHNTNVTIQWCMITEACAKIVNGGNTGHRFGGIWGNNYATYHHNLIAHNDNRNPRWASGCKYNDFRNNVIYNWGYGSSHGGEAQQPGNAHWNFSTINMIANYYKPGPGTKESVRNRIAIPSARSTDDKGSWYIADNYVDGYPAVTADNWQGVEGSKFVKLDAPWPARPINQQTPADAYRAVLAYAGCSKPKRDSIDARIVQEAANGTATYGNNGIITYPSDVGGWPELKSLPAPADVDGDGMPDEWEGRFGFDSKDASDGAQDKDKDGYTNLEEYLNGTDPAKFVDHTKPENNGNALHGR